MCLFVRSFIKYSSSACGQVNVCRITHLLSSHYGSMSVFGKRTLSSKPEVYVTHLIGKHTGVAVIAMNRPRYKNAIGRTFLSEFTEAIKKVHFDNGVKVVIVRSDVPGIFCAGADLKERIGMSDDEYRQFSYRLRNEMSKPLFDLPMPTIAALDGTAVGGGLEIALACDMRTAAGNVKMGLVETTLAIIPGAAGTQTLPRIIGTCLAKRMVFTGVMLNGREAHSHGFINKVVSPDDKNSAYQAALQLSDEILQNDAASLRLAKEAINRGLQVDIETGLHIEGRCYAEALSAKQTGTLKEGLV